MSALDKQLTTDLRRVNSENALRRNLRRRLEICPALAVYWLRMDGSLRQCIAREFSEHSQIRQVYEGHISQEVAMKANDNTTSTQIEAQDVHIRRDNTGVVYATVNGQPIPHVVHHSPSGFDVGFGGAGPADLALSILHDCLERAGYPGRRVGVFSGTCLHAAYALHQDFKWEHIASLDRREREWIIRGETIAAFIEAHRSTLDIYARHNVDDGMMG